MCFSMRPECKKSLKEDRTHPRNASKKDKAPSNKLVGRIGNFQTSMKRKTGHLHKSLEN